MSSDGSRTLCNALLFMRTRQFGHCAGSVFPRRDAPRRGAIPNLESQPLELPLGVHVGGCLHGLLVAWTDAGGAGVCDVAPYAWAKECQCLEFLPLEGWRD